MSYAMAGALQAAVFQHLLNDPGVSALVGADIYDAVPSGPLPETFVTLGPEEVRDRSDKSGSGAIHRFTVTVLSTASGFAPAKAVATAVGDALLNAQVPLSRGHLVGLWFERASARRTGRAGEFRRIEMRFRARVQDD